MQRKDTPIMLDFDRNPELTRFRLLFTKVFNPDELPKKLPKRPTLTAEQMERLHSLNPAATPKEKPLFAKQLAREVLISFRENQTIEEVEKLKTANVSPLKLFTFIKNWLEKATTSLEVVEEAEFIKSKLPHDKTLASLVHKCCSLRALELELAQDSAAAKTPEKVTNFLSTHRASLLWGGFGTTTSKWILDMSKTDKDAAKKALAAEQSKFDSLLLSQVLPSLPQPKQSPSLAK